MRAVHSLGRRSLEQLRRLFLQYSARTNAAAIDLTFSPPKVMRYSLAEAVSLSSVKRESSVLEVPCCIDRVELIPAVFCDTLRLFDSGIAYDKSAAIVHDGMTCFTAEVHDGSFNVHPAMSSQILLSLQLGGKVQPVSIALECKVVMPLDQPSLRRFSKVVHSTPVALKRPRVLREAMSTKVFGEARVRDVPESVQVETPLIRMREMLPGSDLLSNVTAWMPEKKLLAGVVGGETTSNDIQIIGVFRRVPIRSVVRIEIGPGPGNLSLYLRPKCGNMVQSGSRPMFSIAFGRVRGMKEVVRALIPE